ncbi:UDP-2,4-diacetamido-2,4,6-trideoxy-beta-L-altropyranose hydrolase [Marinifilum sp. JC120]|nr:UDP-2,4-diacetamido-2,4,6-trideoxy-beta-L-altropyranose hydrolase [Marinifilum sp. JC120]
MKTPAINTAPPLKGKTLLIHANAGPKIGIGHVMRCLALAQEWIRLGGRVEFIGFVEGKDLHDRIKSIGSTLTSLSDGMIPQATLEAILERATTLEPGSWVMVDNYDFNPESQQKLKEKFPRVLLMDDYHHHQEYHACIILNQNIGAQEIAYNADRDCTILAGTDYVMLRNEFRTTTCKTESHENCRVLLTLGGADADNMTQNVLTALESLQRDYLSVTAVLGPANLNRTEIEEFANNSLMPLKVLQSVSNMSELICNSDLIISAGGSTCWEICALEKPMAVIVTAENQKRLTYELGKNGAALNLGNAEGISTNHIAKNISELLDSAKKRNDLARAAHKLVDGNGVERIINMISKEIIFRSAVKKDCEMILEWANDPETRKWSYNQTPIALQEHETWFAARLSEPENIYLIAENGFDEPIGQIRFQKMENGYEVHVLVAKEFRGGGTGSRLIRNASMHLLENKGPQRIMARAKSENIASVKAFEKAGYRITGEQEVCGAPSVVMEFHESMD